MEDKSKQECYLMSQEFITTTDIERKQNAEILTPLKLVNEMISKIPEDTWTNTPSGDLPKIFDPCVGKGAFVVVIYDLLWEKLKDLISDEEKRRITILEEMLYFADINPFNIHVSKMILDPTNKYKLNAYCGDALKMEFDFKFDVIVGNPPYNSKSGTGNGNTIWQLFVKKYIKETHYLCFVHPSGWRKPNTKRGRFYKMFDLMTSTHQMLYLSIHGIKDGKKTFDAGTRYDWYVIECVEKYKDTPVNDEKGQEINIDMSKFKWLPNYNIMEIEKILVKKDEENCPIIQSMSAYDPRKKWMSVIKNEEFKYPCVHSTPKTGARFMYSSRNDRGHFGVSKIIFGASGIKNIVIDMKGEYGMTQHAMAIEISSEIEGGEIKKVLLSDKFQEFLKSCLFSSFAIDWNIFKCFKKDFWREFI